MLSFCQFIWPRACIFVLWIQFTSSTSKSSVSYSKQCASIVPLATPTTNADVTFPYLQTLTSFVAGGETILGKNDPSHTSLTHLDFYSRNIYATNLHGVYKINAELIFRVDNIKIYHYASNSTYGRSFRRPGKLMFLLQGFWSESSGKGCFVGSAPWYSNKGEPLDLDAMFIINYSKNSTYSNSFVTGELESLSHFNDEGYFESISILSFPQVNRYEYKLISEETVKGLYVFDDDIEKSLALSSQPGEVCSLFNRNYISLKLEHASNCSSSLKDCSPLDGVLGYRPTYVSLYSIQCNEYGNRMRFMVQLTNMSLVGRFKMFDPSATLVGEGLWDETKNCLVIVACRISSSSSNNLRDSHVWDCSFRLSLYYPSVWSIKNRDKAVGQMWTNKTAQDIGYFGMIKFRTSDANMKVTGLKYEYNEIEKVNKLCPKKAVTSGEIYPSGQSYDMRFDMSGLNSMYFVWIAVQPIFIGNESYRYSSVFISNSRRGGQGEIVEPEVGFGKVVSSNIPVNVSYLLSFSSTRDAKLGAGHSSLNASLNSYGELLISAEGVYDAGTGYLCMVGCRNLLSNNSLDCDILLHFQFPRSFKTKGGFINGSMQSTRKQSDPLFFEDLNMASPSFFSVA